MTSTSLAARTPLLALPLAIAAFLLGSAEARADGPTANGGAALRCGWFENPTPGNAWLHDAHGEWTISTQGGPEADGDWPEFKDAQWVSTGAGSSGYGCACMRVQADAASRRITRILSAQAKPLSACRKDKALKEPANPLR